MQRKWFHALRSAAAVLLIIGTGGMMAFGFTGCGRTKYAVDYNGQAEYYRGAKASYSAGAHVKLRYGPIGTDTDYSFYLDDQPLNARYLDDSRGFQLRFTMPDHDVRLVCVAQNSMIRDEPEGTTAPESTENGEAALSASGSTPTDLDKED